MFVGEMEHVDAFPGTVHVLAFLHVFLLVISS